MRTWEESYSLLWETATVSAEKFSAREAIRLKLKLLKKKTVKKSVEVEKELFTVWESSYFNSSIL